MCRLRLTQRIRSRHQLIDAHPRRQYCVAGIEIRHSEGHQWTLLHCCGGGLRPISGPRGRLHPSATAMMILPRLPAVNRSSAVNASVSGRIDSTETLS